MTARACDQVFDAFGLAGCVLLSQQREPKALRGIYHAEQAWFDPDGGPFVVVCEEHHTLVNVATLKAAKVTLTSDFCDDCRDKRPSCGRTVAHAAYAVHFERRH